MGQVKSLRIPLGGKRAFTKGWPTGGGASNDPAVIKLWLEAGCNIGFPVAINGVIVLDVDVKPGQHGAESLAILISRHGPLPNTLTVRTPSGGTHYYFKATDIVQQTQSNTLGDGLDTPGQVACPPTKGYRQTRGGPMAAAPAWLADYLHPREAVEQVWVVEPDNPVELEWFTYYCQHDAPEAIVDVNSDNNTCTIFATAKDRGISMDAAVEIALEHHRDISHFDRWWVELKAHNVYEGGYFNKVAPGASSWLADFGTDESVYDNNAADYVLHSATPLPDDQEFQVLIDGEYFPCSQE
jgi:hypothetical protein